MNATHTPTPWEAHCFMIKAGRDTITQCGYSSSLTADRSQEAEANAKFIVRAVNAHDDMLAALLAARPAIVGLAERLDGEAASPLLRQVDAAIAKARAA